MKVAAQVLCCYFFVVVLNKVKIARFCDNLAIFKKMPSPAYSLYAPHLPKAICDLRN